MPLIGLIIIVIIVIYLFRKLSGTGLFPGATVEKDQYSIDHRYNKEKHKRQREIDRILDKINKRGINSLSKEEKDKLDDYSRRS